MVIIPLIVGGILAVITPWINLGGMYLAKTPLEKRKKLQNAAASNILIDKLNLEQSRKAYLALREVTLIEQAKRDQSIEQDIQDEDIKEKLHEDIEKVRENSAGQGTQTQFVHYLQDVSNSDLAKKQVEDIRKTYAPSSLVEFDANSQILTDALTMTGSDLAKWKSYEEEILILESELANAHENHDWSLVKELEMHLSDIFNSIQEMHSQ